MKRALLLVLVACGPGVDFAGTYEGELTLTEPCSSKRPAYPASLKIVQYKTVLRIEPGFAGCSSVDLEQVGATASIRPANCPATMSWDEAAVLDGRLALDGSALTVSVRLKGAPLTSDESCRDLSISGALNRL